MRKVRGSTLVEMTIACALFAIFMVVSLGMFKDMTRIVSKEQGPAERTLEARSAALKVARRIRNCRSLLTPDTWTFLQRDCQTMLLQDRVLNKIVRLELENGVLSETYYPLSYDPEFPERVKPTKKLYLTQAESFRLKSGGVEFPTRVTVEIVTPDNETITAVTNFREAI